MRHLLFDGSRVHDRAAADSHHLLVHRDEAPDEHLHCQITLFLAVMKMRKCLHTRNR